jgi:hypothetical protein
LKKNYPIVALLDSIFNKDKAGRRESIQIVKETDRHTPETKADWQK